MAISRDYTTGNDSYVPRTAGQHSSVLTRTRTSRDHFAARQAARPASDKRLAPGMLSRTEVQIRSHKDRVAASRLGSKQVVSERGRRVTTSREVRLLTKLSAYSIALLIAGVCMAMWFSGSATSQAFRIQQLSSQEATLDNQLETLHRDLENARSAADVSRRAVGVSMGVPVQAGIVEVNPEGELIHLREATQEMDSIIDVNGELVRPGQASSDPAAARDLEGNVAPLPQGQQAVENAPAPAPGVGPVAAALPARAPYSG
ncbi:hypothetical protein CPHO_04210 [Corynebacterium phocae]|uniref:Uncharacterized protein n=1 Tax=Corynebacterium phocae TaxID=161895 RepID=A0A1L7D2C2_9CORY|nr:hypothetical protein [Corynebacterium phocae]APT92223.1 hypothetical protein CPHO_04210 [Corynebacterium phocae]KAA8725801.1 hypothetical protein F4V58_03755 [Corynebacterium phocae]